jgi:glutamate-ammonia-ligase adenylyltransferase
LEHPTLKVERQWRDPINDEVGGFYVKLGTGGIREIEFVANALQLVWGGKHYRLRTPNTLEAISALESLGHFTPELAEGLTKAYTHLRSIENAIQIRGNQHTHIISNDENAQTNLLLLLGEDSWDTFVAKLNSDRTIVSRQFEKLFAEQDSGDSQQMVWPSNLSPAALEIVDAWENGFHQYGVSPGVRQKLKPLSLALASYLENLNQTGNEGFDSNKTIVRLHDFFRSLPQGEQYFRLLAESPRLLSSMVPPLLYSPAMSTLLRQSPHIVDCYMSAALDVDAEFDSGFVLEAQQYEIRLERMRRFVNEHLYQLYLMFLQGGIDVEPFQHLLSSLAEHTLDLALKVVADNMNLSDPPITVLGMGKVALRRMSPLSDLDLIFIYDQEKVSLELATKFVSRLQTAISTPMREGIVYELDTRLRPSGKSGAPIVSVESFAKHQLSRAHTWEHIALVPSRVVAGDHSLLEEVHQVKRKVVQGKRDRKQFIRDAKIMWDRISEHRLKDYDSSVMFSKLRPGGLMQSEYLTACILLDNSETCFEFSMGSSIEFDELVRLGAKTNPKLLELSEIMQFWRVQQLWERLLGFTEQPLESLPSEYLDRLLDQSSVKSLPELLSKKTRCAQTIIDLMNEFFEPIEDERSWVDEWKEVNVLWIE